MIWLLCRTTDADRAEYVDLVVDWWLNRSVEWQFNAFAQGFRMLCDGPAIRLFNSQVGRVQQQTCQHHWNQMHTRPKHTSWIPGAGAVPPGIPEEGWMCRHCVVTGWTLIVVVRRLCTTVHRL